MQFSLPYDSGVLAMSAEEGKSAPLHRSTVVVPIGAAGAGGGNAATAATGSCADGDWSYPQLCDVSGDGGGAVENSPSPDGLLTAALDAQGAARPRSASVMAYSTRTRDAQFSSLVLPSDSGDPSGAALASGSSGGAWPENGSGARMEQSVAGNSAGSLDYSSISLTFDATAEGGGAAAGTQPPPPPQQQQKQGEVEGTRAASSRGTTAPPPPDAMYGDVFSLTSSHVELPRMSSNWSNDVPSGGTGGAASSSSSPRSSPSSSASSSDLDHFGSVMDLGEATALPASGTAAPMSPAAAHNDATSLGPTGKGLSARRGVHNTSISTAGSSPSRHGVTTDGSDAPDGLGAPLGAVARRPSNRLLSFLWPRSRGEGMTDERGRRVSGQRPVALTSIEHGVLSPNGQHVVLSRTTTTTIVETTPFRRIDSLNSAEVLAPTPQGTIGRSPDPVGLGVPNGSFKAFALDALPRTASLSTCGRIGSGTSGTLTLQEHGPLAFKLLSFQQQDDGPVQPKPKQKRKKDKDRKKDRKKDKRKRRDRRDGSQKGKDGGAAGGANGPSSSRAGVDRQSIVDAKNNSESGSRGTRERATKPQSATAEVKEEGRFFRTASGEKKGTPLFAKSSKKDAGALGRERPPQPFGAATASTQQSKSAPPTRRVALPTDRSLLRGNTPSPAASAAPSKASSSTPHRQPAPRTTYSPTAALPQAQSARRPIAVPVRAEGDTVGIKGPDGSISNLKLPTYSSTATMRRSTVSQSRSRLTAVTSEANHPPPSSASPAAVNRGSPQHPMPPGGLAVRGPYGRRVTAGERTMSVIRRRPSRSAVRLIDSEDERLPPL